MEALRDLAQGWRDVSYRCRYDKDRTLHDDDPGPDMTALQLEWAAREIEGYRRALSAHHDLSTLSDDVIREYDFRECPVCRRARGA